MQSSSYLLQHLAMRAAARDPESVAIETDEEAMTYATLEEHANRLANALLAEGFARGDRVGILMDKTAGAYVAIQGVLKAGCAYVPLDPNAPAARISYIIRDCGIDCVVTAARKMSTLTAIAAEVRAPSLVIVADSAPPRCDGPGPRYVGFDDLTVAYGARSPDIPTTENDLAYILYTSGSTGVPKGVMISHLNSLTFVRWAYDCLDVRSGDRVSAHAPLYFDLSIFDIFVTFMAAATVLPVPQRLSVFPARLAEWIGSRRISVWYSVPSILSMIAQAAEFERHQFPALRLILFAGEVFPVRFLRAWLEAVPHALFYNLYGPTETNVITYYRVENLPASRTEPVPIGKACANMEVFILGDDSREITKAGVEGELYARGSCIAQGYWGDEQKTRSAFVSDERHRYLRGPVYKTGDIVMLDSNGDLLYVGRRDHMVKSRGYRIELGEIEAALYAHEAVKEAAVVAVPDETIGNRLVAFVVANTPTAVTCADLQRSIASRLPRYMLPEAVEFRDELPKTSTGKIDRGALLAAYGRATWETTDERMR